MRAPYRDVLRALLDQRLKQAGLSLQSRLSRAFGGCQENSSTWPLDFQPTRLSVLHYQYKAAQFYSSSIQFLFRWDPLLSLNEARLASKNDLITRLN